MTKASIRRLFALSAAGLCLGAVGCTEFFSSEFLDVVGGAEPASALPGEAPALLVEVENLTGRTIDFQVTFRDSEEVVEEAVVLGSTQKWARALVCPVEEVTLGDLANLDEVGVLVRLDDGTADDPVIEVEPFGVLLQDQVNYNCGDSVTFQVQTSGATQSGYRIFAYIRRSGIETIVP